MSGLQLKTLMLSSSREWGEKETEKARSHLREVGRPEVKSNSVVDLIFSGNFWPPLGVSFLGAPPDKGSATLFPDGPAPMQVSWGSLF